MSQKQSLQPVGVVGLGLMGTAFTERLLEAGYAVNVYNRTRSKAEPLLALGAKWSDNPLVECERVIFSVFPTQDVVEVLDNPPPQAESERLAKRIANELAWPILCAQAVDRLEAVVS